MNREYEFGVRRNEKMLAARSLSPAYPPPKSLQAWNFNKTTDAGLK